MYRNESYCKQIMENNIRTLHDTHKQGLLYKKIRSPSKAKFS